LIDRGGRNRFRSAQRGLDISDAIAIAAGGDRPAAPAICRIVAKIRLARIMLDRK